MKVSESVYSLNIPFRIPAGGGRFIGRSVNAFFVAGREACLVDAGVAGSNGVIFRMVHDAGGEPAEIATLVLTHSHPDHLGSARALEKETGCIVAAHPAERAWIEDTDLQSRERPVPGFSGLVKGPVKVDRLVGDGDRISLGGGRNLMVIHTPGHSPGSLCLFLQDEGVLITGDAIPVKGEIPVYDDPASSLTSLAKLETIPGVKVLLSSWDSPKAGAGVRQALKDGKEVIRSLHEAVVRASVRETAPLEITRLVVADLGLPGAAMPVLLRTVAGHIRVVEKGMELPG